jgi:hypothetical protein
MVIEEVVPRFRVFLHIVVNAKRGEDSVQRLSGAAVSPVSCSIAADGAGAGQDPLGASSATSIP